MPSEPISTLVIENMAARFGQISKANGDWFDILPAQVQTIKRDQTDQSSSGLPAVILFPMDENFERRGSMGFDAPHMFATGTLSGVVQAMTTTDFMNPGQYVRDAGRLKVDMWKAFTKDRSNGGLCDDSIIYKVFARPVSYSGAGGAFAVTMLWRTIIRTIVNDPTQSRNYTNPA
jgi:hypothetical protein